MERRCGYEYKKVCFVPVKTISISIFPILLSLKWLTQKSSTLDEITDRNLRCLKKDVVGEITAVKSTVSDPPEEKNHVMLLSKNLKACVLIQKRSLQQTLTRRWLELIKLLRTLIKLLLSGRLFLNATSGTHIYFDKETTAGEIMRSLLEVPIIKEYGTNLMLILPPRSCKLKELNNRCTVGFYYKQIEKFMQLVSSG
ncbi:hypothetical protein HID58_076034 [Brassica napus]|uniref:Uncharacterized protein n=1 Tax=Brassica napus TaxID=3708 RepID=A0ABQ7YLC4_BRANA|nr:hypothetical protein HID58_076034 [Brassica napus]